MAPIKWLSVTKKLAAATRNCRKESLWPFHHSITVRPYQIDARIRYRLREGKLALWYELIDPKKIIEHAYNEILVDLQNQLPDVPLFEGRI
ncbi:DUF2303 family protein [Serratia plymuthica]|uniref:DUF2303 family protein n=1 Tax=Serratia plymuthica TaxID=82996 RepID=UPI0009B75188|nr:DUF2303 family protein [Serratia plymuthica]